MPAKEEQEHISETFIGLRLEQWLKDGICECARVQHRSASNWVRVTLEKAVEQQLAKRK